MPAKDEAKRIEIARKAGKAVPNHKRSFSIDNELARAAGRKGGSSVKPENRSFSVNKELAKSAGRKGGSSYRKTKTKIVVEAIYENS